MVHISLEVVVVVKTFQLLHFGYRAQSRRSDNLRHTSGENAAAVHSGKNSVFAPDMTDFVRFSPSGLIPSLSIRALTFSLVIL